MRMCVWAFFPNILLTHTIYSFFNQTYASIGISKALKWIEMSACIHTLAHIFNNKFYLIFLLTRMNEWMCSVVEFTLRFYILIKKHFRWTKFTSWIYRWFCCCCCCVFISFSEKRAKNIKSPHLNTKPVSFAPSLSHFT